MHRGVGFGPSKSGLIPPPPIFTQGKAPPVGGFFFGVHIMLVSLTLNADDVQNGVELLQAPGAGCFGSICPETSASEDEPDH